MGNGHGRPAETDPEENTVIDFTHGKNARQGGMDVIISLNPAELDALGSDAAMAADWFDTALWALAMLRTGTNHRHPQHQEVTAGALYTVINDLDHRLIPRLEGIRDAAIRVHIDAGGTDRDLSLAMDTDESTAKLRRQLVQESAPHLFENWARSGGPDQSRD